mmetsp:Transcript_1672/g.2267  ORF Transcript_1672/g.2267 Transcript_1672/m.2267 type:complete len:866 (+) Transcript_1672:125-2722(+)
MAATLTMPVMDDHDVVSAESMDDIDDLSLTEENEEEEKVGEEEELSQIPPPPEEEDFISGTILEAAFVDPAYPWPRTDVTMDVLERKLSKIIDDDVAHDEETTVDTEDDHATNPVEEDNSITYDNFGDKNRVKGSKSTDKTSTTSVTTKSTNTTKKKKKLSFWKCCQSDDAIMVQPAMPEVSPSIEEVKSVEEQEVMVREQAAATVEQFHRPRDAIAEDKDYSKVPEGIFVYRLNTSTKTLTLVSEPSKDTDETTLVREMVIARVKPASGASRRAIQVIGTDGQETTLVACEQRTAVAWHEAMDMMIANSGRGIPAPTGQQMVRSKSRIWSKCNLKEDERNRIEQEYLVLASYSNKLIRTGSIPRSSTGRSSSGLGGKSGSGVGGIYYSVETKKEAGEKYTEETLESISKRRAVITDSWEFYLMVCSLVRDRRKYDEIFQKLRKDPVYPYFNSLTGMSDETGELKPLSQREFSDYPDLTPTQLADKLIADAEEAKDSLQAVCKKFAATFGLREIGIGPIKTREAALKKAERKYGGDLLKVTDYCRALLVVKDIPAVLALLEHARDSFGELIRRVKLTPLQEEHESIIGGYRDVKINVEINGHVCEIQVHVWSMWSVCGVDGYKHYRHAIEYNTDSFKDPYRALDGLDSKSIAELTVVAEERVADVPLEQLEWHHESHILDYTAEVGLFMKHNLFPWAETTLKKLIELRLESPDIGPYHLETLSLYLSLEKCLIAQKKKKDAKEVHDMIEEIELTRGQQEEEQEKTMWDYLDVCSVINPNHTEEQNREARTKQIKASKRAWRKTRTERYPYLHSPLLNESRAASEVSSRYVPSSQSFHDPYEKEDDNLEIGNRKMSYEIRANKYDL